MAITIDTRRNLEIETALAQNLLHHLRNMVSDDDELRADVIEGETNLLEAIDEALARMLKVKGMITGIETTIEAMRLRKARLESQHETLRDLLRHALEVTGERRLERNLGTLSLRNNPPKVEVEDVSLLPPAYVRIRDPEPKMRDLAQALKEGPVPGARLLPGGTGIMIRYE